MPAQREHAREDDRELVAEPAERLEQDLQSEVVDDEERERDGAHFFEVIGLANGLFTGIDFDAALLHSGLDRDERAAMELLAQAVTGRLGERDLLAEDRLADLGAALAELQPVLAAGLSLGMREAIEAFHGLVDRVEALRTELVSLEDAQGELFEQDRLRIEARPGAAKPPTDADEEAPSTLEGGDAVESPPRPSTLSDGPAVETPERPSTLYGAPGEPAVAEPPRPSTLGADEA